MGDSITHPPNFVAGGILGASIFMLDLALRPMLGQGFGEFLRFTLEGAAALVIDNQLSEYGYNHDNRVKKTYGIKNILLSSLTIHFSDFILRPQLVGGMGMEIAKFFIQGNLVHFVIANFADCS